MQTCTTLRWRLSLEWKGSPTQWSPWRGPAEHTLPVWNKVFKNSPSVHIGCRLCHLPQGRERCFLATHKLLVAKLLWARGFLVSSLTFLKIKQSDCVLLKRVWFGPWKALVSFRRDIVQGLARMRIGTKSIWIVVQAGWSGLFTHRV